MSCWARPTSSAIIFAPHIKRRLSYAWRSPSICPWSIRAALWSRYLNKTKMTGLCVKRNYIWMFHSRRKGGQAIGFSWIRCCSWSCSPSLSHTETPRRVRGNMQYELQYEYEVLSINYTRPQNYIVSAGIKVVLIHASFRINIDVFIKAGLWLGRPLCLW